MSTRKQFIAAAAAVPMVAATPPATPAPAPKKREISQAARALAARMREFDPALTGEEVEKIAAGIDDNLKSGSRVNPRGTALKNSDEPVTTFEVSG